jgi:hypothetical protein
MRADRAVAAAATALLMAGCGPRTRSPQPTLSGPSTSADVDAVVRRALQADAAGDTTADTLYAPDALVIANARLRLRAPRLAGVAYGGRLSIAAASTTMAGRFAWVLVDYRWFNLETNQAAGGRATVVCALGERGWKIVHLHSSQPLPWER